MRLDYGLDERLPFFKSLLLGLQWAIIVTAVAIILGKVAASVHHGLLDGQILYLQKLFFVSAVSILVQVLWGHRLPVLSGAAVVALLGVTASRSSSPDAIYTAVMVGGLVLTLLTLSGLFELVRRLFTSTVVAVIMLLVALTLCPTILKLITDSGGQVAALANILFALALVAAMFILHHVLRGIWKSTLMVWTMTLGSLAYFLLFPWSVSWVPVREADLVQGFLSELTVRPAFEPGVMIAFLVVFLALSINDVGAMQSMDPLLKPGNMARRIRRGMTLTGLNNILAGFFGVIGIVNYTLSPGIIASTASASQYALIPAALVVLLLSFSPKIITLLSSVPAVVIGCVLLHIATSQVAYGLVVAFNKAKTGGFDFDDGLVIGLPVLLGTIIAFLPADLVASFPVILRPLLGNGFVVGVIAVFVLEHVVFRGRHRQRHMGHEA